MCSSVLCGGLKTILTASEKTGHCHEEIYKALAEIPEVLNETALIVQVHEISKELHVKAALLLNSVLYLLRSVLKWFCENSFSALNPQLAPVQPILTGTET